MKVECVLLRILHVIPANFIVKMGNAYLECGPATETMTAEITAMKTKIIVHSTHVHPMSSVAQMVVAYSNLGNVITKMTVKMDLMRLAVLILLVQMVNLLAPTLDVFQCPKFATE
uniref:Putative product n=1 Tax=Xenopsylla cheopis TaxID=163159 RepID=A0A6M2DZU7_XENCH